MRILYHTDESENAAVRTDPAGARNRPVNIRLRARDRRREIASARELRRERGRERAACAMR